MFLKSFKNSQIQTYKPKAIFLDSKSLVIQDKIIVLDGDAMNFKAKKQGAKEYEKFRICQSSIKDIHADHNVAKKMKQYRVEFLENESIRILQINYDKKETDGDVISNWLEKACRKDKCSTPIADIHVSRKKNTEVSIKRLKEILETLPDDNLSSEKSPTPNVNHKLDHETLGSSPPPISPTQMDKLTEKETSEKGEDGNKVEEDNSSFLRNEPMTLSSSDSEFESENEQELVPEERVKLVMKHQKEDMESQTWKRKLKECDNSISVTILRLKDVILSRLHKSDDKLARELEIFNDKINKKLQNVSSNKLQIKTGLSLYFPEIDMKNIETIDFTNYSTKEFEIVPLKLWNQKLDAEVFNDIKQGLFENLDNSKRRKMKENKV